MKENPVILVVDDEKDFLQAIALGLRSRGFTVLAADSGDEALSLLKDNTPDVIIADLRMHPMNGFEFCQNVKKIPGMEEISFFFLTGMKDSLAEKFGLTLGAEAYFTKPVDLNTLEAAILNALRDK